VSLLRPKLVFYYLAKHYFINFLALLLGTSLAFSVIDYFQHSAALESSNAKVLYIYYMWQEAIVLLYPLALIFALIMTKLSLVKSSNMVILHSFGYTKRELFTPFFVVGLAVYGVFIALHTTEFSYAKDNAVAIVEKSGDAYKLERLFFIYDGDFVHVGSLDPIKKRMEGLVLFKIEENRLVSTLHAKSASFQKEGWLAQGIEIKKLIYKNNKLHHYEVQKLDELLTLKGYAPKIVESIHEGKALTITDTLKAWILFDNQRLNSGKLRSSFYYKTVFPLFSLAFTLILFFKIPFHARYMNIPLVLSGALGGTFVVWGVLFAMNQVGQNGVIAPEYAIVLPILTLWFYALTLYFGSKETV
jgi:lipopolysaccharide export system permease protein